MADVATVVDVAAVDVVLGVADAAILILPIYGVLNDASTDHNEGTVLLNYYIDEAVVLKLMMEIVINKLLMKLLMMQLLMKLILIL